MGFSVRAFLVNEMGELQRFSYARFQRLSRHDPKESLPGDVGAYARFAIAYIETVEGDPSNCEHVDYIRLKLGPDGRIDRDAERRRLSLAVGSIDLPALTPDPDEPASPSSARRAHALGVQDLIAKVRGAIERLEEYRTALVSAAVTGKIDVRVEGGDRP